MEKNDTKRKTTCTLHELATNDKNKQLRKTNEWGKTF